MMTYGTATAPSPHGWLRWLARLPIWLYRFRLGWLFGNRLLMLTHVGRRSRRLRHVVLEVIRHDRDTETYIIASGFGEKADWFRNILQTSHVLIDVGRRRMEATATQLPTHVAVHEFVDYARRHPVAFIMLLPMLVGRKLQGTLKDCQMLAELIPIVAIRPLDAPPV
jgi:deazaflavin-dependent oxidoreductase (nitroreductase family)